MSTLSCHTLTPADLPIPFGRYVLDAVLGEGGMAKVFRAELNGPAGFTKRVALKVIKGSLQEQLDARQHALFLREARLGGLLRHPNLVDVYELGAVEGEWFLSMEWVDGLTLADAVSRGGALPPPVLLSVARALCAGLHSAHGLTVQGQRMGLVHRDLKPSNVLLGWDGAVKIGDFGTAHVGLHTAEDSGVRWTGGSPGYMSPEQWEGTTVDAASDLFSLGCVLYELALGRYLFGSADILEVRRGVVQVEERLRESGDLVELDRIFPGLGQVVLGCLRVDPADRVSSAAELDAAFQAMEVTVPRNPSVSDWLKGLRSVSGEHDGRETLDLTAGGAVVRSSGQTPSGASGSRHLAPEPNAFLGRESELEALDRMLSRRRLVTVLGPPGTGKTRLVTRFGARWRADGGRVVFCDLTDARVGSEILAAMASALDVPLTDQTTKEGVLAERLGQAIAVQGRVLLVVDNVEQVAKTARPWIRQWWEQAAEAFVLVTSRVPLRLEMEQQLFLEPLPLPEEGEDPEDNAAVALFVERARAVLPGFALNDQNRADVAAIVRELDGLPLAIELAAARVRIWTPKKLRSQLSNRFQLLTRPSSSDSARQSTLQGALDWSWDLLEPWERAALAQASVFRGGFDWEAVEGVIDLVEWPEAPWVVDVVAALVEHSLVMVESLHGERRLRLLMSVSAYGADKLAEMDGVAATEHRHARHYAALGTSEYLASLDLAEGAGRRRTLRREVDNLVEASERAVAAGWTDEATGACLAVLWVWGLRGPYGPAVRLGERVLALEGASAQRAALLKRTGWFHYVMGHLDVARSYYDEAWSVAEKTSDQAFLGTLKGNYGLLSMVGGQVDESREQFLDALRIAREEGDYRSEGVMLGNLGALEARLGQSEQATARFEQMLAIVREVGDRRMEGAALLNLAWMLKDVGRVEDAIEHYVDALAMQRDVGDRKLECIALSGLGQLYVEQDRPGEAHEHYSLALTIARDLGNQEVEVMVRLPLGTLDKMQGRLTQARDHYSTGLAIARELGNLRMQGWALGSLGRFEAEQGDLEMARRHIAEGEPLLRREHEPLERVVFLCERGHVEILAEDPGAAALSLSEAESIVQGATVVPGGYHARRIEALRAAVLADGSVQA